MCVCVNEDQRTYSYIRDTCIAILSISSQVVRTVVIVTKVDDHFPMLNCIGLVHVHVAALQWQVLVI